MPAQAHRPGRTGAEELISKGRVARSSVGVLRYLPARDGVWRAAVSVSKKHQPTAAGRNLLRRRALQILRQTLSKGSPLSVLLSLSAGSVGMPRKVFAEEVARLVSQITSQ